MKKSSKAAQNVKTEDQKPETVYPIHSQVPREQAAGLLQSAGIAPGDPGYQARLFISGEMTAREYRQIFGNDRLINQHMGIPDSNAEDRIIRVDDARSRFSCPGWLERIACHLQGWDCDNPDKNSMELRATNFMEPETAAKLVKLAHAWPREPYALSREEVDHLLASLDMSFTIQEIALPRQTK